jgi:hypothetical protein
MHPFMQSVYVAALFTQELGNHVAECIHRRRERFLGISVQLCPGSRGISRISRGTVGDLAPRGSQGITFQHQTNLGRCLMANDHQNVAASSLPETIAPKTRHVAHFSATCPACGGLFQGKVTQPDNDQAPSANVEQLSGVVTCEHCAKNVRVVVARGTIVSLEAAT